jgi:hypothetical protein
MRALAAAAVVCVVVLLAAILARTDSRVERLEQDVRDIQAELCAVRLVDDTTKPDVANAVRAMCDERHRR